MDEYSYISENGTVRQIRDLIAKAKDEEQDTSISGLAQELSDTRNAVAAELLIKVGVLPYADKTAQTETEYMKIRAEQALSSGKIASPPSAVFLPGGWVNQNFGWTFVIRQNAASCIVVSMVGQSLYNAYYDIATGQIAAMSKNV